MGTDTQVEQGTEQVTEAPVEQVEPEASTEQGTEVPEGTVSLEPGAPPPPKAGTHYSPSEVATFLGLKTTQTIYRWVKDEKIVPAVNAGDRLIAFAPEQVDELRKLKLRSGGGGSRGGKDAKPNAFSEAFVAWRQEAGYSQNVMADAFDVSVAQVGRWERGSSLPTAEAMVKLIEKNPNLASPYVQAKAVAAAEAKERRDAKKAAAEPQQSDADIAAEAIGADVPAA